MDTATVLIDKILLLTHCVAAAVLVGSSTHLSIQSVFVFRGRGNPRLLRIYPPTALLAWAATFALGAWLYPHYRIAVRADYLDHYAKWASILFDIKENLALLVGPLFISIWWMSPNAREEQDAGLRGWFAASCILASAIVWWNFLSGLLVASVRSV